MGVRLTELVSLAEQLAADARPTRARLLDIVRLLPVYDHLRLQPVPPAFDPVVLRLADKLGTKPAVVQHELAEFYRLDTTDYSQCYASAFAFYRNNQLGCEAVAFLDEMYPPPIVAFVVHGVLHLWEPDAGMLCDVIIEGVDYGEEDDRFCRAVDGYLVSIGMAFGSEIEVLAASFYDQWPRWDTLWENHYGWGELGGPLG